MQPAGLHSLTVPGVQLQPVDASISEPAVHLTVKYHRWVNMTSAIELLQWAKRVFALVGSG